MDKPCIVLPVEPFEESAVMALIHKGGTSSFLFATGVFEYDEERKLKVAVRDVNLLISELGSLHSAQDSESGAASLLRRIRGVHS